MQLREGIQHQITKTLQKITLRQQILVRKIIAFSTSGVQIGLPQSSNPGIDTNRIPGSPHQQTDSMYKKPGIFYQQQVLEYFTEDEHIPKGRNYKTFFKPIYFNKI